MTQGNPGDSAWRPPSADQAPDASTLRARRARNGIILIIAIAALAFAAGWNPPTKNIHTFSKASDYNAAREGGCTNSGRGCHGSEKSYADFNVYHPNAKCTTCHDYQGVGCIPCHMPSENECQACHDGSLKQAPDVNRLTDPYPSGHYRETTHTAMGTAMDVEIRGADDGKASASCEECHSRDLAKSHTDVPAATGSEYGTTVGCGECHNDVRSNGLAEVLSDWTHRACKDCHAAGSSSPQHSIKIATAVDGRGSLSCGSTGPGCHNVNELHAIHKDKPKSCAGKADEGEKGCHVIGAEAAKPTGVTCGGNDDGACHAFYENGTYSHEHDAELHSPKASSQAADDSFADTACGDCHRAADDGVSLTEEHELATSARTGDSDNVCRNCHDNAASVQVIAEKWQEREGTQSCSACHGSEALPAAHEGDLTAKHEATSEGCSDTGAGCHPGSDLMSVGTPTSTSGLHRDCLRCHDWRERGADLAYDPSKKTCGDGRDCHGTTGEYDTDTGVHEGSGEPVDGNDEKHHDTGDAQADALLVDEASGVSTACSACHDRVLGAEHARPGSALANGSGTACIRCHNADARSSRVVKSSWKASDSDSACLACHAKDSDSEIHGSIEASHVATELSAGGAPTPGACATAGCHATLDLRVLHAKSGCTATGCHVGAGDILGSGIKSCGGLDSGTACHAGYSRGTHFAEHAGDTTGTVNGVAYTEGANVGCFGCHLTDLQAEHERARLSGELEGGGANTCAICHAETSGAGAYAALPAVRNAIANRDRRCSACHASGSKLDGPDAAASAHKDVSAEATLPAGKVWSDPAEDWKAAFDARTGGGHNDLPASMVGGSLDKLFPLTEFSIDATTYVWALPPNSGLTAWLRPEAFAPGATETTDAIRSIRVSCDDCHTVPSDMAGPHGAAVHIGIDPEYSQTAYANPTRTESQFQATGTQRVICFKCHQIFSGGIEGSANPGGAAVHARHVQHTDLGPSSSHYNGEACIDCHVRIPHAWKRPRMLIRTVETTDGVAPDEFPYVSEGHDGLLGIRLRSFNPQTQLRSGSCVTGGCHPASSPTRHPQPSDVPTATYWP